VRRRGITKLTFLGTKGEIEESSKNHRYHSSLLISYKKEKFQIDYGKLHRFNLEETRPKALLITHAHPDHYLWLKEKVETETLVYLTKHTLEYGKFKPDRYSLIESGDILKIGRFDILVYEVVHSLRCPAVGFRIRTPEGKKVLYNPDLVDIVEKDTVLKNIDYYIGDGSSIRANLVRRKGDKLFGHARITTQINWCRKRGVEKIIFTHLGKETICKEEAFKEEYRDIILAYDGLEIVLGEKEEKRR
jgi:ribonuclease BN (tRNA processing enzyme)